MTLDDLLAWLQAVNEEFEDLKITSLCTTPIHQNRMEVEMTTFQNGQPQTFKRTFNQTPVPVIPGHKHP